MIIIERKICFMLALLSICILANIVCSEHNATSAPTLLEMFHRSVLKRRTRTLVFPNKAQLLLTPAFGKAILGGRPRGLGYSIEFDMYNPLPDTIEGWRPNILLKHIEKENKLELEHEKSQANIETTLDTANDNHMDSEAILDFNQPHFLKAEHYEFPFDESVEYENPWTYYDPKIDNDPTYYTRKLENPHIRRSSHNTIAQTFHRMPLQNSQFHPIPPKFNSLPGSVTHDWHENQSYRERRHIFDQLEAVGKVLNINMKSCIQRAMCEITTHLKPYGESLMDDIARILLTIPSSSKIEDDYNHRRYTNVNCDHRFVASCPYKVLEFLTMGLKLNMH